MMHIVSAEQMRALEATAVAAGATWPGLMERAGLGVAQEALQLLRTTDAKSALVLVGPGNNGGDGLVAARHLHDAQIAVTLYIWRRSDAHADANWQHCRTRGIAEVNAADDDDHKLLRQLLGAGGLVIDALLGTGVSRPVGDDLATIIAAVQDMRPSVLVLAIDLPSGVHADSGTVMGAAIRADLTVVTGLAKRGLFFYPARAYAGTLALAAIGIPDHKLEALMSETLSAEYSRSLLPARPEDAHKGTFGKALVVAGS
ncbi:NAD(P)H-hydrate epimerase, partial [Candidatus Gracilibacteria bacterium]|nr:NAD(P)H-hydrate epimerase [Candidatus Gracilibacteria bacterium]